MNVYVTVCLEDEKSRQRYFGHLIFNKVKSKTERISSVATLSAEQKICSTLSGFD